MHTYDDVFFDYIERGALSSAQRIIPILQPLKIASVLDVGCGRGAWLSEWSRQGVTQVIGLDGSYVDRAKLLISQASFSPTDITRPFDLGRKFDLVECLEVAEHLPPQCSSTLVECLVKHGDFVLFSAAVPGQGGEDHLNERPLSFWRDRFANFGYLPFDLVRPSVKGDDCVEPWYRFNTMLYVNKERAPFLPPAVAASRINEEDDMPDVSPMIWKIRRAILQCLPVAVVSWLATIKHRIIVRR